jgi:hypothetical protein
MIGDWVIDAGNPTVTSFFRELADQDVFARLGITALRLLGCRTADTHAGRATILALANLTGIEVFGTRKLIYSIHYNAHGFADERRYVLVGSTELRREETGRDEESTATPWPQALDIDALPESATIETSGPWAHRNASERQMRDVLRLVKRRDGAQMPGLLSSPLCEILFPGNTANTFRRAQVVLDGEFVRFYPRGDAAPGVVWAVDDPHALVQLVERIPTVPPRRMASRARIRILRLDSVTQPISAGVWTTSSHCPAGRPLPGRAPETPVYSTYAHAPNCSALSTCGEVGWVDAPMCIRLLAARTVRAIP